MLGRERTASPSPCLIGFATKRDLKCELIVITALDALGPLPMVSHDWVTVGRL